MSNEKLREALHRIKSEAVSLADAQVLALEALALPITPPASAPAPAVPQDVRKLTLERDALREKCRELEAELAFKDAAPSQPVTDEWICKTAKRYAVTIMDHHGHNAFLFTLAELLAFIASLREKEQVK